MCRTKLPLAGSFNRTSRCWAEEPRGRIQVGSTAGGPSRKRSASGWQEVWDLRQPRI